MTDQFTFRTGMYRVKVKRLNLRGTKDTGYDNLVRDENGDVIQLTEGKTFPVYAIETDRKGWVWGVITLPDAPQAHYVCLWNLNTMFADPVSPFSTPPASTTEERLAKLEAWARTKGFS